jgi:uncharacterized membrane protein
MPLKWPVVPVPATACVIGGAEPRRSTVLVLQFTTLMVCLGIPRSYSVIGMRTVGAVVVVGAVLLLRVQRFATG